MSFGSSAAVFCLLFKGTTIDTYDIGEVSTFLSFSQLNSVEQHGEVSARESQPRPRRATKSLEGPALEPLVEHPEAVLVPEEQLGSIAPAIEEHVERSVERILLEFTTDDRNEAVVLLAEVHWTRAGEDLEVGAET